MTRVYAGKGGDSFLIRAVGHAGDVASCNYITGVLYAFAGYAHYAAEERRGEILAFQVNKEDGSMLIRCTGDAGVEAAFDAAVIGLLQLEQARPEAIRLEYRE